jgi:recombination protein RecA
MTKAQLEKGFDEMTMGAVARLMSIASSQINIAASSSETTIIWLNQTRSKIVLLGNPETVAGR